MGGVTFDQATIEAELAAVVPWGAWKGRATLIQADLLELAVAANRQGGILRRANAWIPLDVWRQKKEQCDDAFYFL